jgi:hypothetical protein
MQKSKFIGDINLLLLADSQLEDQAYITYKLADRFLRYLRNR